MTHPIWSSEAEFVEFLKQLEQLCTADSHQVVAPGGNIRFAFSALETPIGLIDVFRYQGKDGWATDDPMSADLGQGMFYYNGSTIRVNDLCNSGYKYMLPGVTPRLYTVESAPPLIEIVNAIHSARNVTKNYSWEGPWSYKSQLVALKHSKSL